MIVICLGPVEIKEIPASNMAQKVQTLYVTPPSNIKNSSCPIDMVEIDGDYCKQTDELCLYWITIDGEKTDIMTDRCGEFRTPVHCMVTLIHKHFCIDKYEFPNRKGDVPKDWMSFYDAEKELKLVDKRVCTQSEWAFAAMGPNMHPYPYGDGFHRNHMCNIDRHLSEVGLTGAQVMKVSDPTSEIAQKIRSQLVPSGSMPYCHSDFGVYDMVGNIDEWVRNENGKPYISALMSGHQYGVRNRSTASTIAHGPNFYWYETGARGCKDIN